MRKNDQELFVFSWSHFSFFFFRFIFLFSILLIHLLFRIKFTCHIVRQKSHPGAQMETSNFFFGLRLQSVNCSVRISCPPQFKIRKCDIFGAEKWSFNNCHSVLPPPGIRGEWFLCHQPGRGGQLLNFKSKGAAHSGREDDFRQSSRGGTAIIMTNCWYFHKILHLEFYKFRLQRYLTFF